MHGLILDICIHLNVLQRKTGVSRKYIIQAAACDDCENAFNDAWSKPLEFDVTSLPPKPTGLNIVEENIRDWERADVLLAWDSPNFEYDSGNAFAIDSILKLQLRNSFCHVR